MNDFHFHEEKPKTRIILAAVTHNPSLPDLQEKNKGFGRCQRSYPPQDTTKGI